MTAAKLRELEAKATEGPWNVFKHFASPFPERSDICGKTRDDDVCENALDSNAELIAYLRKHAQDFIKLMEAAELIQGILDHPTKSVTVLDAAKLREALAVFKEQP